MSANRQSPNRQSPIPTTRRSRGLVRHGRRATPADRWPGDDRLGELHQPGGHAGRRQRADQQVRRGLSRPALLRRLRVRRRRRSGSPSTGRSSCSAPSTPTSSRTPGRRPTWRSISRPRAGRHGPGDGPGPRRPPDARHEAELLGQAVQLRQLRRRREDTTASTSTRSPGWPASTSRS